MGLGMYIWIAIWLSSGFIIAVLDLIKTLKKYWKEGFSILDILKNLLWFITCIMTGLIGFVIYLQLYYKFFTTKHLCLRIKSRKIKPEKNKNEQQNSNNNNIS
jgi:hypothetical protein